MGSLSQLLVGKWAWVPKKGISSQCRWDPRTGVVLKQHSGMEVSLGIRSEKGRTSLHTLGKSSGRLEGVAKETSNSISLK